MELYHFVVSAFREGGEFMYLVLLLALPGAAVGTALAIVRLTGTWTPAAAWLLLPCLAVLAGVVGVGSGAVIGVAAIDTAHPGEGPALAAWGCRYALYPGVFGRELAALLLALSALFGGGAAALGAGRDASWTPAHAAPPAVLGLSGGVGIAIWTHAVDLGAAGWFLALVLSLASVGCGLGALRLPREPLRRHRAATARVLGLVLVVLAIAWAARASVQGQQASFYGVLGALIFEDAEARAAEAWHAIAPARWMGAFAFAVALLAGLLPLLPVRRHLLGRRTAISGAIAGAVLLVTLAIAGLAELPLRQLDDHTDRAAFVEQLERQGVGY